MHAAGLRRFKFCCPCGKSEVEWMAETPEIARENFRAFAKAGSSTAAHESCRACGRELSKFLDHALN